MICKYLLPFYRLLFCFYDGCLCCAEAFSFEVVPLICFSFYFPSFWRKIHKIITKTDVHKVFAYVIVLFTLDPHRASTATEERSTSCLKQNNTQNIWQQHGIRTNQMGWMAAVNNQYPWVLQFLVIKKITLHSCRLLELQDNILNFFVTCPVPG